MLKFIFWTGYLLLILGVVFLERKSPTEACLWIVILICLPYLGAVLYLIFGSTMAIKITSFVREKRLKSSVDIMPQSQQPVVPDDSLSEEDRQVIKFNSVYNNSSLTTCENIDIFTSGLEHYTALFQDIKAAKECIYIEFYTIHHDMVGEALVKYLAQKAKEGVKVLVMCDFVANIPTPKKMFQPLLEAGGTVIRIKPYLTHFRSHRKIVVIDHKISYIGGMNVGKQYANMHVKKTPWRDTQVRMEGNCCAVLEDYFLTDWLCAVPRKNWNQAVSYLESIKRPQFEQGNQLCQFIVGGVDNSKEAVKMCYLSMIRSAKEKIRIQTPYFIPDFSILDALKTAAAAGVEIEIMIPGVQSSFFLEPVTRYYVGQLLEFGAKVYCYHGYIHAKTMVIDDELCCIGSVNMDIRSLMVDDEVCGVFYTNELVKQYSDIYTNDIASCTEYTLSEYQSRSITDKIKERVFLPFAPLM